MAAAPLRSFRDLSVDRRDLYAFPVAVEERDCLDRPHGRALVERARGPGIEARTAGTLRPALHCTLSGHGLEWSVRLQGIHPHRAGHVIMAACGRRHFLFLRHDLSSLGEAAFSERDMAWLRADRGELS